MSKAGLLAAVAVTGFAAASQEVGAGTKVISACLVGHKHESNAVMRQAPARYSADVCVHMTDCRSADLKIFVEKYGPHQSFYISDSKHLCE